MERSYIFVLDASSTKTTAKVGLAVCAFFTASTPLAPAGTCRTCLTGAPSPVLSTARVSSGQLQIYLAFDHFNFFSLRSNEIIIYESIKYNGRLFGRKRIKGRFVSGEAVNHPDVISLDLLDCRVGGRGTRRSWSSSH